MFVQRKILALLALVILSYVGQNYLPAAIQIHSPVVDLIAAIGAMAFLIEVIWPKKKNAQLTQ